MDCSLPGSSVHGDSPDKITGVGCYASLQGMTQELNQHLLCLQTWQAGCATWEALTLKRWILLSPLADIEMGAQRG